MLRRVVGLLVGLALVVLGLPALALAAGDANEASCGNEAMSGFSTRLPDCRAYELVSAVDKLGGDVGAYPPAFYTDTQTVQTSPEGERATFTSMQAFGDTQGSDPLNTFLAARGGGGWSVRSISPPKEPTIHSLFLAGLLDPFQAFSSDLSAAVLVQADPVLVPGAPATAYSLYLRNNIGNSYQLLTSGPAAQQTGRLGMGTFQGASADFSHIVFQAHVENDYAQLYEWAGGQLSLVSVLPDGETAQAARLEAWTGNGAGEQVYGTASAENAVSADGSRVFWTAGVGQGEDAVGDLYVREGGASTVLVNASQRSPSLGDGNAFFMGATPDGARVLFTDPTALTNGAGDNGGGLYQFDVETGGLTDLTPDSGGPAEVLGVLGQSTDGSTVYFVAKGVLSTVPSSEGQVAQAGADNLYVAHDGTIAFIAALSAEDAGEGGPSDQFHGGGYPGVIGDWSYSQSYRTARVTPDGGHLVFMSSASLTGYDNTVASGSSCGVDPHTLYVEEAHGSAAHMGYPGGPACTEVFLYDAGANRLTCVSCNPSGARPVGNSTVPTWNNREDETANIGGVSVYQPRYLSEDGGRVFFDSFDALSPRATNGQENVYEWEDGSVYLISSGTSSDESTFADASADGSDVFFLTRSQLVPQDRDENVDLYDARVGGGFSVEPVSVPCTGESCRGPLASPPVLPGAASAMFSGPGDVLAQPVSPAVKPATKKKTKPKKKKKKAKKEKRRAVKRNRRAGSSRAAGKANAMRKGVR